MTSYQNYVDASHGLVYLSTSVDNIPSSRIVSYAVDPNDESVWYIFSMDKASNKVKELAQNDHVAVVTAVDLKTGMRISSNNALMHPSSKTWQDVLPLFENDKGFMSAHKPAQELLYEVHFTSLMLQTYRADELQIINFK